MGMVLHQRFPAVGQQIMRVFLPPFISHGRQRLRSTDKKGFAAGIHLLQINPGRCRIRQSVPAVGLLAAQFSLNHSEILFVLFLQAPAIVRKIGMDKGDIGKKICRCPEGLGQIRLYRLVIAAVHEQKMIRRGKFHGSRQLFLPVLPRLFRFGGHLHAVIIPIGKQHSQNPGSVRGFPEHFRIL